MPIEVWSATKLTQPTAGKVAVGGGPVAHGHGVTDVLVEHGQRGRANDYLVVVVQAMPGQDRRGHLGARVPEDHRDRLAVDLDNVVIHPCPGGDIGVMAEKPQSLRGDVVVRVERVAPVPPIKRRM